MFQILGLKRILVLACLVAFNCLLAAMIYLYLVPHTDKLGADLRNLTSQVSTKRADTERLRNEYQTIQDQQAYFETLKQIGLFSNQNRAVARQRVSQIQKFTNVLTAKYNISSAVVEPNTDMDAASYALLNSPINMEIEAMDDVDLYNFIYWIENSFPGHVTVSKLNIQRPLDVNDVSLRQIGSGVPTALIKGTIDLEWRTMIPTSQITAPPKG